jgi:hypothetical protein
MCPPVMNMSASCLVCTFHISYSILHKIFPIQGYCQHLKNNYSLKPVYKISKSSLCLTLIMTGVSTVPLFSYFPLLSGTCPREKSLCLMFLADLLFSLGSFILVMTHLIKLKTYEKEANAWLFLFENPNLYCLKEIYSTNEKKGIKIRRQILFSAFALVSFVMGVFNLYFPYDTLPLNWCRKWSVIYFFFIQYFGTIHANQRVRQTGAILKAFKKSIKTAFTRKLWGRISNSDFATTLKKYRSLIAVTNLNFALLMEHLLITCFIFTLTSLVCLILNFYILIKYLDYDPVSLVVLQLRTVATVFGLVSITVDADRNINAKVSHNFYLFSNCNVFVVLFT